MRKLKPVITILSTIMLLLSLSSCGNPFDGITAEVPKMPDSLSGANITSSRLFGLTDALGAEYGHFAIVPQIAYNYNGWIESSVNDWLADAIERNEWTAIDAAPFIMEYSPTDNRVIRANDDFSEYELYYKIPTENRYLRVKETADMTHAILVVEFPDSAQKDCIEIIETDSFLYSKGVRIQNYTTTPFLAHFCGITDKSTTNKNTSGRLLAESFDAAPTSWEFTSTAGSTKDTDYYSQENHSFQGPVISSSVGTYDVYGYFDDVNNYNTTADIDYSTDSFPNPQDIRVMFGNGLNHAAVMAMDLSTTFGEGGIELPIWAEGIIE